MGIYFNKDLIHNFSEAIINGQSQDADDENNEDYTSPDEPNTQPPAEDNTPPAEAPPEEGNDPTSETPPVEDNTPPEENNPDQTTTTGTEPEGNNPTPETPPEEDYTQSEPSDGGEPETQASEPDVDYTIPDDAEPEGGDTTPAGGGDDAGEDYTQDAEGGGDIEGGDDTGEDYTQDTGGNDTSEGDGNDESSEDPSSEKINSSLKDKEDELFADLSDEQKAIRDSELKGCFAELYNSVNEIIERINNVHKTEYTLDVFEFISGKLNELKSLIHYYLTVTFDTKSYIENQISYQECLAILNTINEMLKNVKKSQNAQEEQ